MKSAKKFSFYAILYMRMYENLCNDVEIYIYIYTHIYRLEIGLILVKKISEKGKFLAVCFN